MECYAAFPIMWLSSHAGVLGCLTVEAVEKYASATYRQIARFYSLLRVEASRFTDGCRSPVSTAPRPASWMAQVDLRNVAAK
jgi:hypothetical protein